MDIDVLNSLIPSRNLSAYLLQDVLAVNIDWISSFPSLSTTNIAARERHPANNRSSDWGTFIPF
jgi:hypothetical protein